MRVAAMAQCSAQTVYFRGKESCAASKRTVAKLRCELRPAGSTEESRPSNQYSLSPDPGTTTLLFA